MDVMVSGSNLTAISLVFFSLLVIAGKITQIYVDYQMLSMLSMLSIVKMSCYGKEVKRLEEKKGLMKIREVAARLGISIPHAYRLAAEGKIPSVRMGAKVVRFEEAAVERFIRDHRRKAG